MNEVHPILPLLAAAALAWLSPASLRRMFPPIASLFALFLWSRLEDGATISVSLVDHHWELMRADSLGRVFALAFILYTFIAGVYAWSEKNGRSATFMLLQAAGAVGVVLAGDLFSLYIYWELLTVSSLFLIWQGGDPRALAAGMRYVLLHLLGGLCLLAGGVMLLSQGSVRLDESDPSGLAGALILVGLLTNAGVPPLHAWLPDAYPSASIFGTVVLAAYTTKSAVCILIRAFSGEELLVWAGAIMALYGVVFAVLENDIRRLLCYHIVSQVGFMVCGVGLGTDWALNGAAAHAFAHIFYKGLLLMSAGAVVHAVGRSKLTELGQLARPLRWTFVFLLIGAFSIAGLPLLNGFISKSIIIAAAGEAHRTAIELMLEIASMGTFLSIGLKLSWFAFLGDDNGATVQRPVPASMTAAMGIASLICVATGLAPNLLYRLLPAPMDYEPYTAQHVLGMLQLLAGTALGFWILRKKLGTHPTITLDVDRLYRRPTQLVVDGLGAILETAGRWTEDGLAAVGKSNWHVLQSVQATTSRFRLNSQVAIVLATITSIAVIVICFN